MRDLEELNINEGGEPVGRTPPSPELIKQFEQETGLTIPPDYLHLLMHSNGGHPELSAIEVAGRPNLSGEAVNHFYHLDDDRNDIEGLWSAVREWRPVVGNNMLPFAEDGGGNPFLLDLGTTPPRVLFCLHEEDFALVEMAPSFGDFIDSLFEDPDMI